MNSDVDGALRWQPVQLLDEARREGLDGEARAVIVVEQKRRIERVAGALITSMKSLDLSNVVMRNNAGAPVAEWLVHVEPVSDSR